VSVARVACRAQQGLAAPLVQVEVSLAPGLPAFFIVGLPATVVRESKERVRSALLHSRFEFPAGRITVSLSPADLPKEGGRFDLPIALGILLASGQIRVPRVPSPMAAREYYGELGLTGELKPVPGLLLAAAHASRSGSELVVPQANAQEACASGSAHVRAASHLLDVCAHLSGAEPLPLCAAPRREVNGGTATAGGDLAEVRGQLLAKRALVVAAAGGHSLLMIGPPGAGKSMLAQRLPGILPPLTEREALESAAVAAAGAAGFDAARFGVRPFRAPHHTASAVALVGGGGRARPGEISLAHHGVLFLDELPEFSRMVLEALREPLETGVVSVSRAALQIEYPAAFQLIAAMNPCPCGRFGDNAGECRCTPAEVRRYRRRISAPLLDRIDLQVEVARASAAELAQAPGSALTSAAAAAAVAAARSAQESRQDMCNARLPDVELERRCRVSAAAGGVLDMAVERWELSARARSRVLKVARTLADLAGADEVGKEQVGEALLLRCLDRPGAAAPSGATAPSSPCSRRPA
jgi:magnesium chelatase family protein